tara:strand:+ start:1541 stop:3193 length:1653 start_codon:yes stop_codon:yes gene_type:complete
MRAWFLCEERVMKNTIKKISVISVLSFLTACSGSISNSDLNNLIPSAASISIQFSADIEYLTSTESALLRWESEGAVSCLIPGVSGGGGEGKIASGLIVPVDPGNSVVFEDADLPPSGNTTVPVALSDDGLFTIYCFNSEGDSSAIGLQLTISPDTDNDHYPDALEAIVGTDPNDPDSDDDGILDGNEDPNRNGIVEAHYHETDPKNPATYQAFCDGVRVDNEGNGFDVASDCLQPRKIASGHQHTCAVRSNNQAICWGRNHVGQLGATTSEVVIGDDETANSGVTHSGIYQVDAGGDTTCVVTITGSVICWGVEPYAIRGLFSLPGRAIQVSTSGSHACAVTRNLELYCWGNNNVGQLGIDNGFNTVEDPVAAGPVGTSGSVRKVVTGNGFTCALLMNGTTECFGGPTFDPSGIGSNDISAQGSHICFASGGGATCLGPLLSTDLPPEEITVPNSSRVTSGYGNVCLVTDAGTVYCSRVDEENPGETIEATLGVTDERVIDVAAGGEGFSCAITELNHIYCWGQENTYGQLGLGHTDPVVDPIDGLITD